MGFYQNVELTTFRSDPTLRFHAGGQVGPTAETELIVLHVNLDVTRSETRGAGTTQRYAYIVTVA
jgi:hypothetical protein